VQSSTANISAVSLMFLRIGSIGPSLSNKPLKNDGRTYFSATSLHYYSATIKAGRDRVGTRVTFCRPDPSGA
jgi:hypothetical protein